MAYTFFNLIGEQPSDKKVIQIKDLPDGQKFTAYQTGFGKTVFRKLREVEGGYRCQFITGKQTGYYLTFHDKLQIVPEE